MIGQATSPLFLDCRFEIAITNASRPGNKLSIVPSSHALTAIGLWVESSKQIESTITALHLPWS